MKLTVPEAARRAGRNPETIRRWIWTGRLPSEKVGNQHVIDEEALHALLPTSEPEADEEPIHAPGEWEEWLAKARELQKKLRARGARVPPAAEILRAQRRSR